MRHPDNLRVLHLSDLHGRKYGQAARLIRKLAPDWIVLTGDMLPDFPFRSLHGNLEALQRRFWAARRHAFSRHDAITTLVRGNHEAEGFSDPEWAGWVPSVLEGRVGFLEGIPLEFGPLGFPREYDDAGLRAELEAQGSPPILLSHTPPYGTLDQTHGGQHVGHRPLAAHLHTPRAPKLLLCGHVHESFGSCRVNDTLVVNAAGGWALLDLQPATGGATLLGMGLLVKMGPLRKLWRILHPLAGEGHRPG